MNRRRDENLREIAKVQAILKDAIEENGRLITQNQQLLIRHRQRWHHDDPDRA